MNATVSPDTQPRAARSRTRIGSDEARAWVRKLRLGNPFAKSILMAVANYMNEDGSAYPGITTLHLDTDIAEDTIVSRLKWCETIGAIALLRCWVDENGRRNHDGRGRTTSTEIRFLFDADLDEIAANAAGSSKPRPLRGAALASQQGRAVSPRPHGEQTEEISPRPHGELNPPSPLLAPDQPPTPADRREEQESKKDPPNPPSGGVRAAVADDERWQRFVTAWGYPITNLPKALTIWAALTLDERDDAVIGALGYRTFIENERRRGSKRAIMDAHRWLRDKLWTGYLKAGRDAETIAERFDAAENSEEWKAWTVFYRCCGQSGIPSFLITTVGGTRANLPRQWPPVGREFDPDTADWQPIYEGTGQFAAWRRRLYELPGARIATRTVQHEGRSKQALTVPDEWPPNKTGTGPPQLEPSDQDLSEFH